VSALGGPARPPAPRSSPHSNRRVGAPLVGARDVVIAPERDRRHRRNLNFAVDPPPPPQGPAPANELLPDHSWVVRLDAIDRHIPEMTVSRRKHQQLPYPVEGGVHRIGRTDVQAHACLLFVTPKANGLAHTRAKKRVPASTTRPAHVPSSIFAMFMRVACSALLNRWCWWLSDHGRSGRVSGANGG
jgi:hypothetical protein